MWTSAVRVLAGNHEVTVQFTKSHALSKRFHSIIPGGSHTYAKGDDQYPESALPYIVNGKGCHVWDLDGNRFIEYGMGLRAVTLGHAYERVVNAACKQMRMGISFTRPAPIEVECGEKMLALIPGAEMVKFAKNGSDATSGAIRLSRAYTGRDIVGICCDHPFFSVDDWFVGTTPMSAGVPRSIRELTVKFQYNDIESLKQLFRVYPRQVACVILEGEKEQTPRDDFLHKVQQLCTEQGAVMILDEMITGFRWHNGGAQAFYGITPDLSTFGKGMGNGFAVSALVGKRELMRCGGLDHDRDRVFLMSYTQGAETHGLAAALETMMIYETEPVVKTLWRLGERLKAQLSKSIDENKLGNHISILGRPCCLVYQTRDNDNKPSQAFRTLLLQETIKRGVLATSLVVSYSHTERDIDETVETFHEAFHVYRKALDEGIDKYLVGRPVKSVWRRFN